MNEALAAMSALGGAWRGDWSDCDGRTLRGQLDELDGIIRKASKGESVSRDVAAFYAGNGICPICRSWEDHCVC